MNNNLALWLALTCSVVGGTVYITDIKSATMQNKSDVEHESELRIQQNTYIIEKLETIDRKLSKN